MSDGWFSSEVGRRAGVALEPHPEGVEALKDYVRHKTTATEAAQIITRPVETAENPQLEIERLYTLLVDALVELPSEHIEPLLALLQAVENLPEPNFTAVPRDKLPLEEKLWKGLPGFATFWYDASYRSGSWKLDVVETAGPERDALRGEHVRRAEIEARLVMVGLASFPIDWGYEVVVDALDIDDTSSENDEALLGSAQALLDFEVPAAAEWFVICGQRFLQGARQGEKTYALKEGNMDLKQWSLWKGRLRELQTQSGIVQHAARKALNAMNKADRG